MAMALAHVQTKPIPPSQRTELEVPLSLENLILACLEKEPARRPESARRLIDLLAGCHGAGKWTQEEAERWWSTNMPEKSVPNRVAFATSGGDETI